MYDGSCLRYVALWSVLSTRPAPPAAAARPTPHVYENEFNTDTTSSSLAPPPPPPPPGWHASLRAGDRCEAWHEGGWWQVDVVAREPEGKFTIEACGYGVHRTVAAHGMRPSSGGA